jgi:VWFA-related protein
MRINAALNAISGIAVLSVAVLLAAPAASDEPRSGAHFLASNASSSPVKTKSDAPLFEGESGRPSTETHYDPATHQVTIRLSVEDLQGNFVPTVRRDNFVIYENGVRQKSASVEVEHPPVTLGLLLESGGRYPSLNETLAGAVMNAADQLLGELGSEDKIMVWRFGDTLEPVADFSASRETLRRALSTLPTPPVSELNYYDALLTTLNSLKSVQGRNALLIVGTGIDTFSHANFAAVLRAARESGVRIYAISLSPVAHTQASLTSIAPPYAKLNWKRAEAQLLTLTQATGGRTYAPDSLIDLSAIYDDILQNLKARYVLTYISNSDPTSQTPRNVRIALVDATTGRPLKILDQNHHPILAGTIAEDRYVPLADSLAPVNAGVSNSP